MLSLVLNRLQKVFIEPPGFIQNVTVRHNSRLLNIFLLIMIVVFLGVDGIFLATTPGYLPPWYGYLFLIGSYALNRAGRYGISSLLTMTMFPLVIFTDIASGEANSPIVALYYLIPGLILASIFLPFRLTMFFAAVELLLVASMPLVARTIFADFASVIGPFSGLLISAVIISISIYHRDRMEATRQARLRKSEEDYRAIVENTIFGIFQTTPDGRYQRVNTALVRIYGYASQQDMLDSVTNIPQQVYVDPSDREQFLRRLNADGFIHGFIAQNRRKDGSLIWVSSDARVVRDVSGKVAYFEGTVEDITEKRLMEQARQLSEERYRLISSVISDYVFSSVQSDKGAVTLDWVAGAFEQITGYAAEELSAPDSWRSIVHPDDQAQDLRDMDVLLHNQRVISELRILHKDGSIRWVRSYAHPVWDLKKNQLAGIYGAVQDITERKRIEQEREDLIRELEAKNAELEQFTYTVSHDLKAPLITIKGFLGLLSQDTHDGNTERVASDVRRISDATDKMHNLLNDLLELSRIGRVMNEPLEVDLDELAFIARSNLHGQFEQGRVEMIVSESLPKVYGDRQRLLEVLQNLMDNAIKFMGAQLSPRIEIGCAPAARDAFATLYVRDNGIGIDPQFHERIFGLFNRLNPEIEGTGVGLALAKRIIEFHGGRIWVESAAGEGATFYFTLPTSPLPGAKIG
ncbi:MAG: PAS domain S-box protein [Anaerolineales bacterium]|nr:PAS domain S-box protein [Anaerolineales bacterium]